MPKVRQAKRPLAAFWVYGTQLRRDQQSEALTRFVYRPTVENSVNVERFLDGYRLPLITDADWLKRTQFAVRKDGGFDRRVNHCLMGSPWDSGADQE